MNQPLSHTFVDAVGDCRDRLYARAMAGATNAAAAEALLQKAIHDLFGKFAHGAVTDIAASLEHAVGATPAADAASLPMPADVWARLVAAIQLAAAQSEHTTALHPDSVLLRPDPLLAPRGKRSAVDEETPIAWSPGKVLLASAAALLLGIAATVYIVARTAPPPHSGGPTTPASTAGTSRP